MAVKLDSPAPLDPIQTEAKVRAKTVVTRVSDNTHICAHMTHYNLKGRTLS